MLLSGRSPIDDAVVAQLPLAKALVFSSGMPAEDLTSNPALAEGVGPLAFGLGPALALAAAWKISRRADHISKRLADLASGGAEDPDDRVLLGFTPDGRR